MSAQMASYQYLKNKVEAASPIGRIVILMDAGLAFLAQSMDALRRGDKVTFVDKNIRVQNIIRELRNALNLDMNEEVAGGFYRLYNYMLKQLMQSVRTKTIDPCLQVQKMLGELCMSWKQAEAQGLGRDVAPPEARAQHSQPSRTRVFAPTESYATLNQGLNFIS